MGHNMLRLIRHFWTNQRVVPRQSGFHGATFDCTRGQTQGGLFSPLGFNIVIDAAIREWLHTVVNDAGQVAANGFGFTMEEWLALFYADDGFVGARDDQWLNNSLQVLADIFQRLGLESNPVKTKSMTCLPTLPTTSISTAAYTPRSTGVGPTYSERLSDEVQCPECGKTLARGSLPLHRRWQHGMEPPIQWNMANINPPPSQLYVGDSAILETHY
jgi:Reverse transcriptase (RNA-dependent DNA polymerase)